MGGQSRGTVQQQCGSAGGGLRDCPWGCPGSERSAAASAFSSPGAQLRPHTSGQQPWGMQGPMGTRVSPCLPGEEKRLLSSSQVTLLPWGRVVPRVLHPMRRHHPGWNRLPRLSRPEQRVTQVCPGISPIRTRADAGKRGEPVPLPAMLPLPLPSLQEGLGRASGRRAGLLWE